MAKVVLSMTAHSSPHKPTSLESTYTFTPVEGVTSCLVAPPQAWLSNLKALHMYVHTVFFMQADSPITHPLVV